MDKDNETRTQADTPDRCPSTTLDRHASRQLSAVVPCRPRLVRDGCSLPLQQSKDKTCARGRAASTHVHSLSGPDINRASNDAAVGCEYRFARLD